MEMFNEFSGKLLYFVFANREDTFYTESLTGMNLQQYLWYHLRKAGNKGVAFLSGNNQNYRIECMDNESFTRLRATDQGWGLFSKKLFGTEQEISRKQSVSLSDSATVCKRILRLFSEGEGRQAVVVSLDCFAECFGSSKNTEYLRELIHLSSVEIQDNRHNTLVLTSSMKAESSRALLMHPLWTTEYERETLCPELAHIIQKSHRCALYEDLKWVLEERMLLLQSFSKAQIRLVVERSILEKTTYYSNPEKEAVTLFLFHWMHDNNFRRDTKSKELLSKNPLGLYGRFYRDLCDEAIWSRVVMLAGKLDDEYANALVCSRKYLSKCFGAHYYNGHASIVRTDEIAVTARRNAEYLSEELRREFSCTWTKSGGANATLFYKGCFDELDLAVSHEDILTQNNIRDAMEGYKKACADGNTKPETLKAAANLWTQMIAASRQVNLLGRKAKDAAKELEKLEMGPASENKADAVRVQKAFINNYTQCAINQTEMIRLSMLEISGWLLNDCLYELQKCSNDIQQRSNSITSLIEQTGTNGKTSQILEQKFSQFRFFASDNREADDYQKNLDRLQRYMATGHWEEQTA